MALFATGFFPVGYFGAGFFSEDGSVTPPVVVPPTIVVSAAVVPTSKTFRCLKSMSGQNPVYALVTMKRFYAGCSLLGVPCNKLSSGFVAASTICSLRIYR